MLVVLVNITYCRCLVSLVAQPLLIKESQLDEATLQQVADITGGQFYRAEDTAGLKAIYDEINQLEKSQVEVQVFNQYQELAR